MLSLSTLPDWLVFPNSDLGKGTDEAEKSTGAKRGGFVQGVKFTVAAPASFTHWAKFSGPRTSCLFVHTGAAVWNGAAVLEPS